MGYRPRPRFRRRAGCRRQAEPLRNRTPPTKAASLGERESARDVIAVDTDPQNRFVELVEAADRAALYGLLAPLGDLGIELIALRRSGEPVSFDEPHG